jgi:hypothetical protein
MLALKASELRIPAHGCDLSLCQGSIDVVCHVADSKSTRGKLSGAVIHRRCRSLAATPVRRDTPLRAAEADAAQRRAMNAEEKRELEAELERLRQEHRDLDAAIGALLAVSCYDRLQVQRLKKRKLQLRDRIQRIDDQLFPDIIA